MGHSQVKVRGAEPRGQPQRKCEVGLQSQESTRPGLSNTSSAASPCSLSEFQCNSGECTPRGWRCDQEEDCTDGSDELGCGGPCMLYQMPCAHSPHCVSPGQLCDGVTQCPDGSDEDPDVCSKSHRPYSVPLAGSLAGWGLALPEHLPPLARAVAVWLTARLWLGISEAE